jgi:hypothetical protein
MADLKEQRACIKLCFKLGKNATETFEMWKVCFGKKIMGRAQVSDWLFKFRKRCEIC